MLRPKKQPRPVLPMTATVPKQLRPILPKTTRAASPQSWSRQPVAASPPYAKGQKQTQPYAQLEGYVVPMPGPYASQQRRQQFNVTKPEPALTRFTSQVSDWLNSFWPLPSETSPSKRPPPPLPGRNASVQQGQDTTPAHLHQRLQQNPFCMVTAPKMAALKEQPSAEAIAAVAGISKRQPVAAAAARAQAPSLKLPVPAPAMMQESPEVPLPAPQQQQQQHKRKKRIGNSRPCPCES